MTIQITKMCLLIQNNLTLDKIYEIQLKEQKAEQDQSSKNMHDQAVDS